LTGKKRKKEEFGMLLLMKDMKNTTTEPYLLKRVEQLRRSMIAALGEFEKTGPESI
jgi:hypothetical protein